MQLRVFAIDFDGTIESAGHLQHGGHLLATYRINSCQLMPWPAARSCWQPVHTLVLYPGRNAADLRTVLGRLALDEASASAECGRGRGCLATYSPAATSDAPRVPSPEVP